MLVLVLLASVSLLMTMLVVPGEVLVAGLGARGSVVRVLVGGGVFEMRWVWEESASLFGNLTIDVWMTRDRQVPRSSLGLTPTSSSLSERPLPA